MYKNKQPELIGLFEADFLIIDVPDTSQYIYVFGDDSNNNNLAYYHLFLYVPNGIVVTSEHLETVSPFNFQTSIQCTGSRFRYQYK